jgi:hypothetical protein
MAEVPKGAGFQSLNFFSMNNVTITTSTIGLVVQKQIGGKLIGSYVKKDLNVLSGIHLRFQQLWFITQQLCLVVGLVSIMGKNVIWMI